MATMKSHQRSNSTFSPGENVKYVGLATTVVRDNSFVISQSRNDGDSTYGGSAGNCFITSEISADGTQLILRRVRNWDQAMVVEWDVYEMDYRCTISGEITLDHSDHTTGSFLTPVPYCNIAGVDYSVIGSSRPLFIIVDIRGNGFGSSVKEWSIIPIKDMLGGNQLQVYHNAPIGTILRYQIVSIPLLYASSIGGDFGSKVDGNYLVQSSIDPYKWVCLSGGVAGKSGIEPLHSHLIEFTPSGIKFRQFVNAGASLAQNFFGGFYESSKQIAYHGYATLSGSESSKDIQLPNPVKVNGNVAYVNGHFLSFASVNTYVEEFGDFAFTAELIDTGEGKGLADKVRLKRGVSGGLVDAQVSWSVVNMTGVEGIVPVTFMDYKKICKSVAICVMRGVA